MSAHYLDIWKKLPQGLPRRESVVARTAAEAADRQCLVRFHYARPDDASAAADALNGQIRSGATRQPAWSEPLPKRFARFMGNVTEARVEDGAVVLRGDL